MSLILYQKITWRMAQNVAATNLDQLNQDELPIVVNFLAPWCSPCRSFAPFYAEVGKEHANKVFFTSVNSEAEPELNAHFRSIPTIMVFSTGKMADTLNGAMQKAPFDPWLNTLV